jgi:hypothetical protein
MLSELFQIAIGFPTALYTGALGLACLYWLFVMVGAVDLDFLGGADGAMDGALDGAMDGALDGALDGAMDGALDGAMDAAGEAAGEAAGDAMGESIGEAVEGASSVLSFLGLMGLRKAPFTVVLSFWSLFAWMICAWVMSLLGTWGDTLLIQALVGAGVFFLSLVISMPLTAITIRPLGPLFEDDHAPGHQDMLGKSCQLDTGKITPDFGQAVMKDDQGNSYNIQVRCRDGNGLKRGDELLILSVVRKTGVYNVVAMSPDALHTLEENLKQRSKPRAKPSANKHKQA